jgi:hypothetical protein
MFPSKRSSCAAIMSSLVAGTFALALTGSPAQASTTPAAGQACPPSSLFSAQALAALNLKCVGTTLTSLLPIPTTPPTTSPAAAPTTPPATTAPNPLSGLVSGVTGTVNGLVPGASSATGPVSGAVNGAVGSLLGGLPSTTPGTPAGTVPGSGTTTGTSTGTNGGTAKPGSPLAATTKAPSTKDGSSLLGPAAAFLPGASLAGFADLSSNYGDLLPLSDNIPSPLIASADSKLSAVQAPLIAAGQRAATQADSGLFTRFGGKALPGLLVVIGTALVAAVGAGNLRAWQARFGGANLRAWKRSTK